jgi:ribulose-phosphate 3-epimerase
VRRLRGVLPPGMHVQVDGGVGHDNVRALYEAGADLFVTGTAIFGREDLPRSFRRLVEALR